MPLGSYAHTQKLPGIDISPNNGYKNHPCYYMLSLMLSPTVSCFGETWLSEEPFITVHIVSDDIKPNSLDGRQVWQRYNVKIGATIKT